MYDLGGAQRTKGTHASPTEGTNQPHLSKRQNIGIRTQWRKLASYIGCRREGEKHYSERRRGKSWESKWRRPAAALSTLSPARLIVRGVLFVRKWNRSVLSVKIKQHERWSQKWMFFKPLHLKKQNFFIKIFTHDMIDHIDMSHKSFYRLTEMCARKCFQKKFFLRTTRLIFS